MILKQYTIPGIARTKKNHMQLVQVKGRMIPVQSKQYKEFESRAGIYLSKDRPEEPISTPVEITCIFLMPRNKDGSEPLRPLDLCNLLGAVDDILVTHKIIKDDDNRIVKSHDGSRIYYTAGEPQTLITISEYEE